MVESGTPSRHQGTAVRHGRYHCIYTESSADGMVNVSPPELLYVAELFKMGGFPRDITHSSTPYKPYPQNSHNRWPLFIMAWLYIGQSQDPLTLYIVGI